MKKILFLLVLISILPVQKTGAQVFTPIAVTGHNVDAIAENTTAISTTNGTLDAAGWIFYSAAYGAIMSSPYGLPNSGLLAAGTRTYQLQPYTQSNLLYLPAGAIDSLVLVSPTAFSGISIAAFSAEGAGSMNVTIRYTDNTTFATNFIVLPDWFGAGTNTIIAGVDRCLRSNGTPALTPGSQGNPKIFYFDIPINCGDRVKNIKTIKIQNPGTGAPRSCIMAVSGAAMPVFTPIVTPVTCSGGHNGSATISVSGGVAPYAYTISTSPAPTNTSIASNIGTGVYSYTAQDAGQCPVSSTFAITQSLTAQPPLNVSANSTNICIGSTVAIGATGATSYTWSTNSNQSTIIDNPGTTTTYSVDGLTSAGCLFSGTITITVNPLPVVSISGLPNALCSNSPSVQVTTTPAGGTLTGQGLQSGAFVPSLAGVGTKTLSYTYKDNNNCSASTSASVIVNAAPVVTFTASANALCLNSPTINLTGSPNGGNYTGTGVSGTVFSPTVAGVGTHTINYSYTDANSCSGSVTSSIIVNGLPAITFTMSKTSFCNNAPFLMLTGTPGGGTYSGPGITGSLFSPSVAGVGTHTVTYTNSDVTHGCTDFRIVTVTVGTCSFLEEWAGGSTRLAVYPNPSNGSFTIQSKNALDVTIINDLGQEIGKLTLSAGNNNAAEVQNLAPGIYFLVSEDRELKQKIIVLK